MRMNVRHGMVVRAKARINEVLTDLKAGRECTVILWRRDGYSYRCNSEQVWILQGHAPTSILYNSRIVPSSSGLMYQKQVV